MTENDNSVRQNKREQQTDAATAAEMLMSARRDWDYLSDEEKFGAVDEALNALVCEGERIMNSELTGRRYLVTKWVDIDDMRMVAIEKELVEEPADA